MPLTTTPLPYGLRDVKITPYNGAALAATSIDLPNARTFSFSEAEDFEELRGDDKVVTVVGKGPSVEWELESGGLPFEAARAMIGGTITETGTAPAQKKTWTKRAGEARPFFKVEGQAISDSGGDVHCVLDRCRTTGNFEGEFGDGSFWLSKCDGVALPSQLAARTDIVYEFTQNEVSTPIA